MASLDPQPAWAALGVVGELKFSQGAEHSAVPDWMVNCYGAALLPTAVLGAARVLVAQFMASGGPRIRFSAIPG